MAVLRLHRPTLMNIAEDIRGQLDRRNCVVPGPHIPPEICTLIGYYRAIRRVSHPITALPGGSMLRRVADFTGYWSATDPTKSRDVGGVDGRSGAGASVAGMVAWFALWGSVGSARTWPKDATPTPASPTALAPRWLTR